MTGSALMDFLIGAVVLVAVVVLIFMTADKLAPDPWAAKLTRVVVGVIALIAVLVATKGIFFGGGGTNLAPMGGQALISFGIGLLVLVLVVFLLNMLIDYCQFMVETCKYVLGIVALIVLLTLAGATLFGGANFINFSFQGNKRSGLPIGAVVQAPPSIIAPEVSRQ